MQIVVEFIFFDGFIGVDNRKVAGYVAGIVGFVADKRPPKMRAEPERHIDVAGVYDGVRDFHTVSDKRVFHLEIEIERILFFGFFRRFKVHDERVAGVAFRREDVVAGKSVIFHFVAFSVDGIPAVFKARDEGEDDDVFRFPRFLAALPEIFLAAIFHTVEKAAVFVDRYVQNAVCDVLHNFTSYLFYFQKLKFSVL